MITKVGMLAILLVQGLFWNHIVAAPATPLHDLFNSPDIPVLDALDLSMFNLSARHNDERADKRAVTVNYVLYSITMNGQNQGNWENWVVKGGLLITQGIPSSGTQNGQNPMDVVIVIGNPAVNPVAGSLRYATNRYLYQLIGGNNVNSVVDYAYVSTTSNSITVNVDTRIAAANQLSNFNARSGLLANVYIVAQGGFSASWSTTSLSGKINLVGRDYISAGTAPYNALISGTVVGRGTTSI